MRGFLFLSVLLLSRHATGFHTSSGPSRARPSQMSVEVPRQIVVIGGGWAGYTAAEALSKSTDCQVTLLDAASPKAAGGLAGGWRTEGGRPVEAGIHGFWREYRNTFAIIDELGLQQDDILSPYTPSVLVSKSGKVATAPVLATDAEDAQIRSSSLGPEQLLEMVGYSPIMAGQQLASAAAMLAGGRGGSAGSMRWLLDLLPAPLDTALLAEFSPASPLTLVDRASAIGLLAVWADFVQEDPASWARYDSVSAEELFKKYGGVTGVRP